MLQPGIVTQAILNQRVLVVDEVTPYAPDLASAGAGDGVQAFMGVALKGQQGAAEQPGGILYVGYRRPHCFTLSEKDLVEMAAQQAAIAIQNKRQDEKRRKAETLAALSEFGGNFAHRVVNLVADIPLVASELEEAVGRKDWDMANEYMVLLADGARRVRKIVEGGKALRTFQQGHREYVQINDLVQKAAQDHDYEELTEFSVVYELDPQLPPVRVNRGAMQNVFADLIDNAVRAMPTGGQLRLISRLVNQGHWISIRIVDTGCGIPQAIMARLFEPFKSGRPEGVGLGLWLDRQAVREMGGEISIESQIGSGTSVTILLPVAERTD